MLQLIIYVQCKFVLVDDMSDSDCEMDLDSDNTTSIGSTHAKSVSKAKEAEKEKDEDLHYNGELLKGVQFESCSQKKKNIASFLICVSPFKMVGC